MANKQMPQGSLKGQHVLLIAPRFFGYEETVAKNIEAEGAVVDWLADRPFDSPVMAGITKLNPRLIMPFADRIYSTQLNRFGRAKYDKIVVINGQTLSQSMLTTLKNQFPMATVILYMWDSLGNRGHVAKNFRYFDRIISFDPDAASDFNMEFRPLFYSASPSSKSMDYSYDVSFVGTCHSDRYAILNKIDQQISAEYSRFWYRYLQSESVYFAYKLSNPGMRHAKKTDFRFEPIAKQAVECIFERSRCVVDIEHPLQRGLTMRTLEVLGAQKKMITTNRHVTEYNFFNENNICVVDRSAPEIPKNFLVQDYEKPSTDVLNAYSIKSWIRDVVSDQALTNHFMKLH